MGCSLFGGTRGIPGSAPVMVTLLAVSSFRASNTNLKVIASMQGRGESAAAAQWAIEQTLSSSLFATDPTGVSGSEQLLLPWR